MLAAITRLIPFGRVRAPWAGEVLGTSLEALGRYKLRTFLSVLGVVLGVTAVIAMMSVSDGGRREALAQVAMLGLDNVVVRNRLTESGARSSPGLEARDTDRLTALIPNVVVASPLLDRWLPVAYAGRTMMTNTVGVRSSYQTILRLNVSRGRFLAASDDASGPRVCVLGHTLARRLFGYADPIGDFVRLGEGYWKVVGVLAERTAAPSIGALAWRDLDTAAIVPLTALSGGRVARASTEQVDEVWLQVGDGSRVESAGLLLGRTMSLVHSGNLFDVVVPRELLQQRYRVQRTFSIVVGSIAVLALVVGGIGIMNIMLTSVIERTAEIGIRRTVGATRQDITNQFIVESLLMTLGGGLLGIVVGVAVSWGITAYAGWATSISIWSVALGFLVSLSIGLVFGIYPAVRAARQEPVDALRYE